MFKTNSWRTASREYTLAPVQHLAEGDSAVQVMVMRVDGGLESCSLSIGLGSARPFIALEINDLSATISHHK